MKIERHLIQLISTTLLSSLLIMASSFLLARLLSVEDRGTLLLFVTSTTYLATLGTGGVGFALTLSMRQRQYQYWQGYIIAFLLYGLLASYIGLSFTEFQPFAFLFILNVGLTAIFNITLEKSKIDANMAVYRLLVLQQPFLSVLCYGLCYIIWGQQALDVVLGLLTFVALLQALFCLYYLAHIARKFQQQHQQLDKIQAKFFLTTWVKQNLFQLFGATVVNLDKFMIALLMNHYVLGLYAVCLAFDALITRFINSLADYYYSGLLNQVKRLKTVLAVILVLTIGVIVVVPLLAAPVIKFFFGESYLEVAPLLLWFMLNAIIAGLGWLLSQNMLILGKQPALLLRQMLSILVFCGLFYLFQSYQLLGVAYALLGASVVRLIISIIYYYKYPVLWEKSTYSRSTLK